MPSATVDTQQNQQNGASTSTDNQSSEQNLPSRCEDLKSYLDNKTVGGVSISDGSIKITTSDGNIYEIGPDGRPTDPNPNAESRILASNWRQQEHRKQIDPNELNELDSKQQEHRKQIDSKVLKELDNKIEEISSRLGSNQDGTLSGTNQKEYTFTPEGVSNQPNLDKPSKDTPDNQIKEIPTPNLDKQPKPNSSETTNNNIFVPPEGKDPFGESNVKTGDASLVNDPKNFENFTEASSPEKSKVQGVPEVIVNPVGATNNTTNPSTETQRTPDNRTEREVAVDVITNLSEKINSGEIDRTKLEQVATSALKSGINGQQVDNIIGNNDGKDALRELILNNIQDPKLEGVSLNNAGNLVKKGADFIPILGSAIDAYEGLSGNNIDESVKQRAVQETYGPLVDLYIETAIKTGSSGN